MLNIEHEMKILRLNVEYNIKCYYQKNVPQEYLLSFREDNWLLSFPFNFNDLYNDDPEIIRKIAVINCLYLSNFLKEDFLLDDYNTSVQKFGEGVKSYCYSKLLSNLAVRQYIYHFGSVILKYLLTYEEIYYSSLFKEKNIVSLDINQAFSPTNLLFLGQKLLPLVTSYAGYCIIKDKESLIPKCEDLIINYHVAKQLYDDLKDIKEDLLKPDNSYLTKLILGLNNSQVISLENIKDIIYKNNLDLLITDIMRIYLEKAIARAEELKFDVFMREILLLNHFADNYTRN